MNSRNIFFNTTLTEPDIGEEVAEFKKELMDLYKKYGFDKKFIKQFNGNGVLIGRSVYLKKGDEISYGKSLSEIIHDVFGFIGI